MTSPTFITKLVVDSWHIALHRLNQHLDSLTNDQLMLRIAPGRNRGVYLLGHLTTVHDKMLPLLFLGDVLYPELNDLFLTHADNPETLFPAVSDLRGYWHAVNSALGKKFVTMTTEEWLHRHSAISEEDFAKEPHRNRLSVLLNRTNHMSNHYGQLLFLKKGALE